MVLLQRIHATCSNQLQVVDPQSSADRTSARHSKDSNRDEMCISLGHECAIDLGPILSIVKVLTQEKIGVAIRILNRKSCSTRTFHFFGFVVGRELVLSVRFDRDDLLDSSIHNAGTFKEDAKRAGA